MMGPPPGIGAKRPAPGPGGPPVGPGGPPPGGPHQAMAAMGGGPKSAKKKKKLADKILPQKVRELVPESQVRNLY
jgi:SWI/SNF-related matrix-associated actin-dependent regulator of chromatin subfamily D